MSVIGFLIKLHLRTQLTHRAAFFVDRLAQVIAYGSAYATIWILVHKFDALGGWRWPELALLLGFQLLAYSIGASFSFIQMRELQETIRTGAFDALMVKPYSPWAYLVFSGFHLGYLGHIILALGLIGWTLTQVPVVWTLGTVAFGVLALASSALAVAAIITMIGAAAFVLVRSRHLYGVFFGLWELTRYPLDILPASLQWLMLTALPLGLLTYVPVSHLLGKPTVIIGELGGALSPLAGPLLALVAIAQWRYCLSRYRGAGS